MDELWELAWSAWKRGRYATALAAARRYVGGAAPENRLEGSLLLVKLLAEVKRFSAAEQVLDGVLEEASGIADPDFQYAVHVVRGELCKEKGDYVGAEAFFRKACDYSGEHTAPLIHLGGTLWYQGKLAEAEAAYRRATTVDGDVDEAFENLGYVLRAQERNEEALAALRESLTRDPGNRRVRRAIEDLEAALAMP